MELRRFFRASGNIRIGHGFIPMPRPEDHHPSLSIQLLSSLSLWLTDALLSAVNSPTNIIMPTTGWVRLVTKTCPVLRSICQREIKWLNGSKRCLHLPIRRGMAHLPLCDLALPRASVCSASKVLYGEHLLEHLGYSCPGM